MRRLLAALLVALTAPAAVPAAAVAATHPRVLILSLPTLTWEDVQRHDLPNIEALLTSSAVGNLSLRAIGPETSLEEAYASIGAGNRARGSVAPHEGYAADAQERVAEGVAADAYLARMGTRPPAAAVLALNHPGLERANRKLAYGAEPGALGGARVRTGVVANADRALRADEPGEIFRPAVAAMMDRRGAVARGTVGPALLEAAPGEPFGVRQSLSATSAAARAAWDRVDALLVEASDLVRADQWRDTASAAGWRRARSAALARSDELVAGVVGLADPARDLVLLVSPVAGGVERLTVVAARGPGMRGGQLLRSPSTRRAGYVTLPDVAPTVLAHLGVEVPGSMTGRAMQARGSVAPLRQRAATLADVDRAARFRDRWLTPFLLTFVILHALLAIAAIAAVVRPRGGRIRRRLGAPALVLLALPVSSFLLGLLPVAEWSAAAAFAALAALAAGLAASAHVVFSRLPLGPPLALATLTMGVLVVDVVTTERLQINTLLGYSPIVAGRFQGFGNQAFALLVASTILAAAWLVSLRGASRGPLAAAAALFVVALVANGAPPFGSDVGGILAATPAYGAALLLFSGRPIGWRRVLLLVAAAAVLLAVAALVDVARPPAERTHLGRVVQRFADDPGTLALTIRRKLLANLSVLRKSSFSYLVPVLLGFLAALAWRPVGLMRSLTARHPVLRPALIATLVAAVLGFLLNDSGIAVPGIMLTVLNPVLLYAVASEERIPDRRTAPAPPSPA